MCDVIPEVLRAVVALVVLAWLPGRAWRPLLLPALRGPRAFVVDVVLSVAMMVAALFGAQAIGVTIGAPSALWIGLAIAAAGFARPLAGLIQRRGLTDA